MRRFIQIVGGTALGAVTGCAATVALGAAAAAVFYAMDGGTGKYSAGNGILYVLIFLAVVLCGVCGGSVGGCVGIYWKKTLRAAALAGSCCAGVFFLIFLVQLCQGL